MIDSGDAQEVPAEGGRAWVESTPLGERYLVAIAPRGALLYPSGSGSDVGSELFGFVLQTATFLIRSDDTWKVGVFDTRRFRLRRCLYKQTGLSEAEAEREVERLLSRVRRGIKSWD